MSNYSAKEKSVTEKCQQPVKPQDDEFFKFFKFILEDVKGTCGRLYKDYENVLTYLLYDNKNEAKEIYDKFKEKYKTNVINLSFNYYKETALEDDRNFDKNLQKHVISKNQREKILKYALNMWLSIHH